jgi:hypothetical protein
VRQLAAARVVCCLLAACGVDDRADSVRDTPDAGKDAGNTKQSHDAATSTIVDAGRDLSARDATWFSSPVDSGVCRMSDCEQELRAHLDHELGVQYTKFSYEGSQCVGCSAGKGGSCCECTVDGDGSALIAAAPGGCAVRGHAHDCLIQHGEIAECDNKDPDSCKAACTDLAKRRAADALVAKPYVIRATDCDISVFEGTAYPSCSGVVEIEGSCYPATPSVQWDERQACVTNDE